MNAFEYILYHLELIIKHDENRRSLVLFLSLLYVTRLEAPSRVPLPSVLLFDFIALVCFHFAANISIIPSVLYFLPKRSSSVTNPGRRNTQKYSIEGCPNKNALLTLMANISGLKS